MKFKLNPITGDLDRVTGNGNYIQKLNPITGKFNLVDSADSYKQIINPLTGNFQLWNEGGGGEQLPVGYARLEYIESTGTQYIDTGVSAPTITRFIVKGICHPNGNNNTQLLGGTSQSATTFFGARVMSGLHWYCMSAGLESLGNPEKLSTIDCTINSDTSQTGTLVDHVAGTTTDFVKLATNTWAFPDENLLVFGGSEARIAPSAACYGLKLYVGETLVRDLVPAERYDGVIGLYDLVNGVFYYNQGTDEFVSGPYVLPEDYTENEFYETKGSLLPGGIDTGIKPTYGMVVKGKYSIFHNSSIYILGARAAGSEQGLTKPQTMTFSGSQNGGTVTALDTTRANK